MDVREVGGEFVALDGDTVLRFAGPAAEDYRAGGISRRKMLAAIGAGAAVVGVSAVAAPPAWAANSHAHGSITPTTGPKGTVVSLTGGGFTPNSLIQVTVAGVSATLSPANVTTDANGDIPAGVTFTIPNTGTNTGAQPVAVIVNGFSQSVGNFIITTPTVSPNPGTLTRNGGGGSGQTYTFTGSGFLPGSSVTVTRGADLTASSGGPFTVSPTGTISGSVTGIKYPNGAGSGTLTFTDTAGNTTTVTLNH